MLGKVLKYEFKAGGVILPLLLLVIGAAFGLGVLARQFAIIQAQMALGIACVLLGVAAMVLAAVTVIRRYYATMFGREAYLVRALPVSSAKLIGAKMIFAMATMIAGVIIMLAGMLGGIVIFGGWDILTSLFGMDYMRSILWLALITGLIQGFCSVSIVYFSITLSNTKGCLGNNVAMAVVFFFLSMLVMNILNLIAMLFVPLGITFSGGEIHLVFQSFDLLRLIAESPATPENIPFGIASVPLELIVGIVLLFVTRWLTDRKTAVK